MSHFSVVSCHIWLIFQYYVFVKIVIDQVRIRCGNTLKLISHCYQTNSNGSKKVRKKLIRQLADVDVEFAEKKHQLNSFRNAHPPISSLPNEILVEIFTIGHRSKPSTPFEVLVSHVSHHWREVALGTPKLWAKIHRQSYQRAVGFIAAYLQRSRQLPIYLTFNIGSDDLDSDGCDCGCGSGPEQNETEKNISRFRRLVKPHISRCKTLIIESESYLPLIPVLRMLSAAAVPALRLIRINVANLPAEQEWQLFRGGAPLLNHVYLFRHAALFYCHPHLDHVTTLRFELPLICEHPNLQRLSNTLSAMSCLTHLVLAHARIFSNWPSAAPINLNLPALLIFR